MEEKNEEAIEMERNWVDLPPELFPLILKNLLDISDFVRYRAVCKTWRFFSAVSDLPPQFPWLIRLNRYKNEPDLHFYSIVLNKIYTIRPPIFSGYRFYGPAGCYMVIGQEYNAKCLSFRNPLNNSEVPLPVPHYYHPYVFSSEFCHLSFQTDNYMLISEYKTSVGCKLGGDRWDIIGPGHGSRHICYYFKGLLFRYGGPTRSVEIIDISTRKELYVISLPEEFCKMTFVGPYFVESCGEILTVCYNCPYYSNSYKKNYKETDFKFYIHRLEFGNGKGSPSWVKLCSIGDRILFFETPPPGYCRAFSLTASDFAGFKGNCIYIINRAPPNYVGGHLNVINMYDIENDETTIINTPFNQNDDFTWFMPTLNPM